MAVPPLTPRPPLPETGRGGEKRFCFERILCIPPKAFVELWVKMRALAQGLRTRKEPWASALRLMQYPG